MASEPREFSVYFVPTPIGNRDDVTLRALDVLRSVDTICCEDTRHSGRLLKHHDISKPLLSYHEHNEAGRAPELVSRAQAGETFAVISDAGMPGISDPGYRLLAALQEAGVSYSVLPGPSAVLTALVGSGMPSDAFFFGGFLPVKKGKRRKQLEAALEASHTSLFFESPHRLPGTLEILADIAFDAPVCVARELTKTFESFERMSAQALHEIYRQKKAKGEIVLVVGGVNCPRATSNDADKQPTA